MTQYLKSLLKGLSGAKNNCIPPPMVMESTCLPEPPYSMASLYLEFLFTEKDLFWVLGIYIILWKFWISDMLWDKPILFLSCPSSAFHFSCLSFALLAVMFFFLPSKWTSYNFLLENKFHHTLFPVFQVICFSKWLRSSQDLSTSLSLLPNMMHCNSPWRWKWKV